MVAPAWLKEWARNDGGTSSFSVAATLIPEAAEYMEGRLRGLREMDAPYDYADCERIVRLLDLCEANGRPIRSRMSEMAHVRGWHQMAAHWAVVEDAMKADDEEYEQKCRQAQLRRDGKPRKRPLKVQHTAPCRTYLVVCALRGRHPDHFRRMVADAREFYDPEQWLARVGVAVPIDGEV